MSGFHREDVPLQSPAGADWLVTEDFCIGDIIADADGRRWLWADARSFQLAGYESWFRPPAAQRLPLSWYLSQLGDA